MSDSQQAGEPVTASRVIEIYYLDPADPEHAMWRRVPADGYHDLQRLIGGCVQAIRLSRATEIYVDEDGKARALPMNPAANRVVFAANPGLLPDDFLCGPAALIATRDAAGVADGLEHSVGPDAYALCAQAGLTVIDQREP